MSLMRQKKASISGRSKHPPPNPLREPLTLLSVILPGRNEEGCIASTVEQLHVELRLWEVPHEIVVLDDGSTGSTWQILLALKERVPTLTPVQNRGPHGFGRAIVFAGSTR
jgi:dolichol-phosphate mannosyltransferase